jgi:hypothetical protein
MASKPLSRTGWLLPSRIWVPDVRSGPTTRGGGSARVSDAGALEPTEVTEAVTVSVAVPGLGALGLGAVTGAVYVPFRLSVTGPARPSVSEMATALEVMTGLSRESSGVAVAVLTEMPSFCRLAVESVSPTCVGASYSKRVAVALAVEPSMKVAVPVMIWDPYPPPTVMLM